MRNTGRYIPIERRAEIIGDTKYVDNNQTLESIGQGTRWVNKEDDEVIAEGTMRWKQEWDGNKRSSSLFTP